MENAASSQELLDKFLRKREHYSMGDVFAEIRLPGEGMSATLSRYLQNGLYLFALSTKCPSCLDTIEELYELLQDMPINAILFVECDEEEGQLLREGFEDLCPVIPCSRNFMVGQLQVPGFPWLYYLDSQGVIMKNQHFVSKNDLAPDVPPPGFVEVRE